jgi:hypothetical protein
MSELSIDELQTETGELLPEREALGTIVIGNIGSAIALQAHSHHSVNVAVNIQTVVIGSSNRHGGGGGGGGG